MTSSSRNGNSRGVGCLERKCPLWRGMDIFWTYNYDTEGASNSLGLETKPETFLAVLSVEAISFLFVWR